MSVNDELAVIRTAHPERGEPLLLGPFASVDTAQVWGDEHLSGEWSVEALTSLRPTGGRWRTSRRDAVRALARHYAGVDMLIDAMYAAIVNIQIDLLVRADECLAAMLVSTSARDEMITRVMAETALVHGDTARRRAEERVTFLPQVSVCTVCGRTSSVALPGQPCADPQFTLEACEGSMRLRLPPTEAPKARLDEPE
jgi:hypothetical protein